MIGPEPHPEQEGASRDDSSEAPPVEVAADRSEDINPNVFADNRRRRIPGVLYCCIGAVAAIAGFARAGDDPVLVNLGVGIAGVLLIIFGVYSIVTGWGLDVDEEAALQIAAEAVQRPMGHASAQMGWRGWLSRPTWRILWYSAEDPPRHRGLVFVDGRDGQVLDFLVEANPETDVPIDWRLDDENP